MAKKTTKKSTVKKSAAKKIAVKKAAKKATAKKTTPKKAPAKKAAKKVSPKKTGVKKVFAKKTAPKKVASKKTSPKKVNNKTVAAATAPKTIVINPYLTFNGTCEEAFNFYRAVFGGNFAYVGRFNEMPPMDGYPPVSAEVGNLIMHISLPISKETILMGSDSSDEFGKATVVGNNFGISISATSEKEADRLYNALAENGKQTMPMSKTFWGSYWGMLTDKFEINWMVSFG